MTTTPLSAARVRDVTVASLLLVVTSPLLVAISIAILVTMGRPVFFVQQRPGLHGEPFRLVKFRTMTLKRGDDGELLPDEQRLTGVGRFLRATSLDELPELWHVFTGEMSLVGPRPLLPEYLDLYSPEQARRHEVPPGITGLAQVEGRNALDWEERLALDVRYVEERSFWLDVRILARTLVAVLTRRGVRQPGHATSERFRGSGEHGGSAR
ncbi:MAG: sugar transferase [Actinobacteria bacterium]|nr:sugar transferase [Actinomycetota bacterium]